MSRLTHRAEDALLGAMLHRPDALPGWITPGMFSSPDRAALWRTLQGIDFSKVERNSIPAAVTAAVGQIEDAGIRACLTPSRLAALVQACPDRRTAALYGGMVLESAIHRSVEHAGEQLRHTARQAEVDQAPEVLEGARRTETRLTALGSAWSEAPETVRNLLDTTPAEPVTLAPRQCRTRTDLRAEAETVASLLYQPAQLAEVTGWLRAGDFSDPQLATVYRAMTTLADRRAPVDPLTVAWEAARHPGAQPSEQVLDELDRGGTPSTAAFTGEQVLATAALDRLDAAGHRIRNLGRHPGVAPTGLIGHATQALEPVAADRERMHHVDRELEPAPADAEPAPAAHTAACPTPDLEIDL
ncbi:DnaB-like helicase N-terminal domain-containing protein [Streptomyces sparsogenes]|uniref:DnaB-like helicase N-terminal domain-containing protein n=1 Tax=Streptomyces sparsogenes TaxID=67365 RepID=UPI0033DAF41C